MYSFTNKFFLALVAFCYVTTTNAKNVCITQPGSISCGSGTINKLNSQGIVSISGTTITGPTIINGLLSAEKARFSSLDVNGSAYLVKCTITSSATIRGSLSATSTKFQDKVDVYSNSIRFTNSKISSDLHLYHSSSKQQTVTLDKASEISGNIIFDDGNGNVVLQGNSKIGGKIIGGQVTVK